jgi:DNA ligase (NAD+)
MSEVKLNKEKSSVIEKMDIKVEISSLELMFLRSINELSLNDLVIVLKVANALYCSGIQVIKDESYDAYITELKSRQSDHPYLLTVEPEVLADSKTVPLPKKMLPTDKAYSFEEIKKWNDRLLKAAIEVGVSESKIQIKVTPKLDGYAAYDDGKSLCTRGDGARG